jgi:hypothetical protein
MGVYYFECGIDGGFEKEHSSGDPRNPCPLCRIAELEAEVERMENLLAEGIHTCNPTCKRPLCVLRRENKALREALETLAKTTNTPVLQPLHQIAKAALLKEGGDG